MISKIRSAASWHLENGGGGFRKCVWLHSVIPMAASALLVLLNIASGHIAPEGGLSNIETHTMISTALTLLQIAITLATLFWDAGLNYITLSFLYGNDVQVRDLTMGFPKFRPILGSWVYRWLIYFIRMMIAGTLSSMLMSFVPISGTMMQELQSFTANPVFPLPGSVLTLAGIYLLIYLVVLAVSLLPMVYRHRLTTFFIVDDLSTRGMQAVMQSAFLMRGHRLELFKLDLRFWWFYLGQAGVLVLSFGELINPDFPHGSWLFPLLALAFQLGFYLLAKPRMALCYGLFYQKLLEAQEKANQEDIVKI